MADTEEPAETSLHDPKFYIEDGNIVLSARDSENCIKYSRLYRSTLVEHSPVFRDMFAMPPPPNTDQYKGAPLVRMPDDADALRDLIACLYDTKFLPSVLASEDFAIRMLEPTRLAKKYQIDWICEMVGEQLENQWPTSLEGWDTIATEEANRWTREEVGGELWEPHWQDKTLELRRLPEPVSAILLARECDVPYILPFAFLHLLRLPLDSDPTAPDFQPLPWTFPQRSLLSHHDLHRLALARERIGRWFAGKFNHNIWQDCGSGIRCEATTLLTWYKIAKDVGRDGNVLQADRWTRDNLYLREICPACREKLVKEIDEVREEFVAGLRTFFQLE